MRGWMRRRDEWRVGSSQRQSSEQQQKTKDALPPSSILSQPPSADFHTDGRSLSRSSSPSSSSKTSTHTQTQTQHNAARDDETREGRERAR